MSRDPVEFTRDADARGSERCGNRVRLEDTSERVADVDSSTHVLVTIDYAHHEIHSGNHFYVKDVQDLAGTSNYDLIFLTPDTLEYIHLFFDFWHEQEGGFVITEDATVDNNGTPVVPVNNNRNSAHAPVLKVFHTPTNPGGGTVIYNYQTGAGKQGGGDKRPEDEIVLKRNTRYWMRLSNKAAGNCLYDYHFKWYEHTDKG